MNETPDIYELIDDIVLAQSRLMREERIKRFATSLYPESIDFDGTKYIVRTFFDKDASENLHEKIKRTVLKNKTLTL